MNLGVVDTASSLEVGMLFRLPASEAVLDVQGLEYEKNLVVVHTSFGRVSIEEDATIIREVLTIP